MKKSGKASLARFLKPSSKRSQPKTPGLDHPSTASEWKTESFDHPCIVFDDATLSDITVTIPSSKGFPQKNAHSPYPAGDQQITNDVEKDTNESYIRRSALSKARTELDSAVSDFIDNYRKFASKYSWLVEFEDSVEIAIREAEVADDIKRSAQIFECKINATLGALSLKQHIVNDSWIGKVGKFLGNLYPVARLAVDLTSVISEGTNFLPLKGAANGLAIILQVLETESSRSSEFHTHLRRIEYQTARLSENPSFAEFPLIREKSIHLMIGIITFFNSTLVYFNRSFFTNLLKNIGNYSSVYEDGKNKLEIAIQEYDQAVLDFTASLLADSISQKRSTQKQKENEGLWNWLGSSYWLVEAELQSVRDNRSENSLLWARNMPEFANWRMSDLDIQSKERILWIRGKLGVGKSTMSGFYIDLIRTLSPSSIVTYFFCKSGRTGLMNVRDIIRTIAHQLMESNSDVRSILEAQKRKGLPIDEEIGIGFLFEQLIRQPLLHCKSDIHIILDGLDEADLTLRDLTEPKSVSQMELFLKRLASLPNTRLLLVSRPNIDISQILPNSIARHITNTDNYNDIHSYIQQIIDQSKKLQLFFAKVGINPLQYFKEKANGIFLWVVIALRQLEKAKSTSIFRKYLDGFSEASGDIELLYSRVLTRFEQDDQVWLKEIFIWLVIKRELFGIEELKEAVELSLGDELPEFDNFIVVDCGSILEIKQVVLEQSDYGLPSGAVTRAVELIHETVRSFLINPQCCDSQFYVHEGTAHRHALRLCLEALSGEALLPNFARYAARNWIKHFMQTSFESQLETDDILSYVFRFFESGGCKSWIRFEDFQAGSRSGYRFPARVLLEGKDLRQIHICLSQWKNKFYSDNSEDIVRKESCLESRTWAAEIVKSPLKLSEYFGKAAAELWLFEPVTHNFRAHFWLSMEHYCRVHSMSTVFIKNLHSISVDDFAPILEWVCRGSDLPRQEALGNAFAELGLWKESRRCFMRATETESEKSLVWAALVNACMKLKDGDGAINALNGWLKFQENSRVLERLGRQLCITGNIKAAIPTLERVSKEPELDMDHHFPHLLMDLGSAYGLENNYEGEIRTYKKLVDLKPQWWWTWQLLGDALLASGDAEGTLRAYQLAQELNVSEEWARVAFDFTKMELDTNKLSCISALTSIGSSITGEIHAPQTPIRPKSQPDRTAYRSQEIANCVNGLRVMRPRNSKGFDNGCFLIPNKTCSRPFDLRLVQEIHHLDQIWSVDFSGNGEIIAIAYRAAVQIFSLQTENILATLMLEPEAEVWDGKDLARDPTIITCICLSADGDILAVGAGNGLIHIWYTNQGIVKHKLDQNKHLKNLTLSADGRYLASSSDSSVWIWDVERGTSHCEITEKLFSTPLALSSDGALIALSGARGGVLVYDTNTAKCIQQFDLDSDIPKYIWTHISFSETHIICGYPDGLAVRWEYVRSTSDIDGSIITLDSSNNPVRCGGPVIVEGIMKIPQWSPDCELVITSSWDTNMQFWNVKGPEPCFMLCDPDITWGYWPNEVLFAKNATGHKGVFATWSSHNTIGIWRYEQGL